MTLNSKSCFSCIFRCNKVKYCTECKTNFSIEEFKPGVYNINKVIGFPWQQEDKNYNEIYGDVFVKVDLPLEDETMWRFSKPEFLGKNYVLQKNRFNIEKKFPELIIGPGIGNIEAIKKLELYGDERGSLDFVTDQKSLVSPEKVEDENWPDFEEERSKAKEIQRKIMGSQKKIFSPDAIWIYPSNSIEVENYISNRFLTLLFYAIGLHENTKIRVDLELENLLGISFIIEEHTDFKYYYIDSGYVALASVKVYH